MAAKATLPEPSSWEKKWRKREVTYTAYLTVVGVIFASLLGIGQLFLRKSQQDLAKIGVQTAQNQALASLIIALGHESPRVRKQAATGLALFADDAIPPLMIGLGDDDKETRSAAAIALVCIYKMHKTPMVASMIEEVESRFEKEENKDAIEGCLLVLLETKKREDLYTIIKRAPPGSLKIKTAIDTLEQRKHFELLKMLLELQDLPLRDQWYIITAIEGIGVEDGELVVEYLIGFNKRKNPDEETRIRLVISLDNIMERRSGDDACASLIKPALLGFLNDDSARVRKRAVSALKKFRDQNEVREALQRVSQKDRDDVRDEARRVLESKKCKKFQIIKEDV